jgi:glycosyltransferase involved in cell wall biosynthesis
MAGGKQPMVTIGIPTYNRAASLQRAVDSVLTQDFRDIELLISDNASTDGTQAVCEAYCRQDCRVRYMRQPRNQGARVNFLRVLQEASGEYFMWLADDDWIEPSYVALCLGALTTHRDYALVSGTARYFNGDTFVFTGKAINLVHERGWRRVLAYYTHVADNAIYYGLMRRTVLDKVSLPVPNILGDDWLLVAGVAFLGKVKTLQSVTINRDTRGLPSNLKKLARAIGTPGLLRKAPNLEIALNVRRDITRTSPVYEPLGVPARSALGWAAFLIVFSRYCVLAPAMQRLERVRAWPVGVRGREAGHAGREQ